MNAFHFTIFYDNLAITDFLIPQINIRTEQSLIVSIDTGPPSITTHPRDVTIPLRSTTTLTCSVDGYGTLIYSWERRSGSSWTTVANSPSYTTNSNMTVGQYMYRCIVSNEAGSVMSNSTTVNVYGEYCPNR